MSQHDEGKRATAGREGAMSISQAAVPQAARPASVALPVGETYYTTVQPDEFAALVARALAEDGARLLTMVGEDRGAMLRVTCALAVGHSIRALTIDLEKATPRYPALTPQVPAAHWYERELADLFGIHPDGHPHLQPLVRHAWPDGWYPLRRDVPPNERPLDAPDTWQPVRVAGSGAFEIPYGPVRSGVFESAQFLVQTAGEDILALEVRPFYKHRGAEKIFETVPLRQAVLVAEHVAGVAAVAHALAFCQAVERAAGITAPPRAEFIRLVCAELERVHNHLDSVMRLCETASLGVGMAQFAILKERILRLGAEIMGHRFLRGVVVIGGVRQDLTDDQRRTVRQTIVEIERDYKKVRALFLGTNSMMDRLISTGRVSAETAALFGAVGPVARGSGLLVDCRVERPYGAYPRVDLERQVQDAGDAMARTLVRLGEIENAFLMIHQAVEMLPPGRLAGEVPPLPAGAHAFGWAEAPQGEVVYYVVAGDDGRLARCKVRSPSFVNWALYDRAMPKNVLTDVGFIEHSFGLSQAGCDG